jgi:hypothetical protein
MNKIYVVTLELIIDLDIYISDEPHIILSNPFLITEESDPVLIADFVISQEIQACINFDLEDHLSNKKRPLILAKYKEISF